MKKKLLIVTSLFTTLAFASCFKDDVAPITGKNSSIMIDGIVVQNLVADNNTSIKGVAKFEFYVANGVDNTITDTVRFADSFYVINPGGYKQNYDFDTPEKAKVFNFNLSFIIQGGGSASGVTVSKLLYKTNNTPYLDKPLTFSTTDNAKFTAPTQTVNF